MKFFIAFLSLILIDVVCGVKGDPCDGEVFSLGCKMFELIKKNANIGKKKLDKKFDVISKHRSNDTREIKLLIADDINKLSSKEAEDIKIVTELLEEKLKVLKDLLTVKIQETNDKLDNRTGSISRSIAHEIANVKTKVLQQIGNTTVACQIEVKNIENKIEEHMNISNHAIEKKFLKLEEDVIKSYVTIETKLNNNIIKATYKLTERIANNTAIYKKGLNDLETKIQGSIKNISIHDIEKEILQVKKDVDMKYKTLKDEFNRNIFAVKGELNKTIVKEVEEKYTTLKEEVKNTITKITGRLKTTIESEVDTKYHSLKKELNDNIAKVIAAVTQDIRTIKFQLEGIKKSIKSKEWPEGHYCLFRINNKCPPGFYVHTHFNVHYCCR